MLNQDEQLSTSMSEDDHSQERIVQWITWSRSLHFHESKRFDKSIRIAWRIVKRKWYNFSKRFDCQEFVFWCSSI